MSQITNSPYFGVGAALSAAIFWSIAVIIFKSASDEISPFLITALKNTIATICFFFLFILTDIPIWYNGFEKLDYYQEIDPLDDSSEIYVNEITFHYLTVPKNFPRLLNLIVYIFVL